MKSKTKKNKSPRGVAVERMVSGRAYAWLCDFGLCHWAAPTKDALRREGAPSPEAYEVPVRIITEKDYRRLIAR